MQIDKTLLPLCLATYLSTSHEGLQPGDFTVRSLNQSFGQIVSKLARGEEIAPESTSTDVVETRRRLCQMLLFGSAASHPRQRPRKKSPAEAGPEIGHSLMLARATKSAIRPGAETKRKLQCCAIATESRPFLAEWLSITNRGQNPSSYRGTRTKSWGENPQGSDDRLRTGKGGRPVLAEISNWRRPVLSRSNRSSRS